ncbi:MAG: hypothetical protein K0Q95_1245 [Bacteroidota bacterium]|jgi:hypothetical protein|nr:hypothetical protein [Bacteroidota bacterium]
MKMEQEKKIEEIMNSFDGMRRAQPSPFIYSKILQRIEGYNKEYSNTRLVWLAAASFAILIILNFLVIKNTVADKKMSSIESQSQGYNLVNVNTVNYN